jgi:hypothetical protein
MFSIRLTEDIEYKIEQIAKNENCSKTDVVKDAIELYLQKYKETTTPYELGRDLFGKYGSGKGDLSKEYKNILKAKLRAKHSH